METTTYTCNYVKENDGIIWIDGRNYMSYEVVYADLGVRKR